MKKRKGFSKRIVGMALAVVICLCGAMVPGVQKASAAEQKAGNVIDVPYVATSADISTDTRVDFQMSGENTQTAALKVRSGVLCVGFLYDMSALDAEMTFSLYMDEACQKKIASVTGKEGEGELIKALQTGTYYLKVSGKAGVKYEGFWSAMSFPEKIAVNEIKLAETYFFTQKAGKITEVKVSIPQDGMFYAMCMNISTEIDSAKIALYDESGKKISDGSFIEGYREYALKKGTYKIRVTGDDGIYMFGSEYEKYKTVRNTSKSRAENLKPSMTADTLLFQNGSKAGESWYKFTLKSDTRNKITIWNYSEQNAVKYQVFRGKTGVFSGTVKPYEKEVIDFPKKDKYIWKAGDYYIKLYKADGDTSAPITVERTGFIQNMKIAGIKNQSYTGNAVEPSVRVKNGSAVLKEGRDYKLSYANNQSVGTATVKITGKGNYSGSKTVSFKIVPKTTKIAKTVGGKKQFLVKWKKISGVNGYQVRYAAKKSMKGAKILSIPNKKVTSAKVKNLSGKKTYFVQVRSCKKVSGKNYCSKWSSAKPVKTK